VSTSQKPLEGIRVLSFENQVAGPYCTMMLADQGAEVIKIERPKTGDTAREAAPIVTGAGGRRQSGYFLRFNRNKRSITLDLKAEAGRTIARDLALRSDVLVQNFRPGLLDEMGLGYEDLSKGHPGLIYTSITGFGSLEGYQGAYSQRPAYDIVAQAMGGLMNTCGQAEGPPTWLGVALGDIVSGMLAAQAVALALYQRTRTGRGQYLDVSMYDAMIALAERSMTAYSLTGHILERGREPYIAPWGPFRCADGWIAIIVATEGDWKKFCQAMERPDLIGREDTGSGPARAAAMNGWLGEIVSAWFLAHTTAEAVDILLGKGLPIGPVQNAKDVVECPHAAARRTFIDVPDPILGEVRLVGPAVKMSASLEPRTDPAPLLGQHTDEILGTLLEYPREKIAALRGEGVV
jgi:CoA:oxalate CoA-transferase